MATKRQLIETFGEERDGKTFVVCPHCDDTAFESLEQWKDHMQAEHGGYTVEEVSEGLSAPPPGQKEPADGAPRDEGGGGRTPPPPSKPKKLSAKARELNDKCNRCVSLILKHFTVGMSPEELQELENNRADITQAFVGIEFDFEERLFSIEGKWAIIFVLVALYVTPYLPNLKTIGDKVRERNKKKEA